MTDVVNRERQQRLKAIKEELAQIDREAARCMWEWGVRFAEVEKEQLWRYDGATSFSNWADEKSPYTYTTARRSIDVYRHFTLAMCDRWGSTKLGAALRLAAATNKEELPGDITAMRIRVREPSGQYTSKSFAEASTEDIREAYEAHVEAEAARKIKAETKEIDPSLRARAVRLGAAMGAAPRGTTRGDRVVVHKSRDGELALTFKAVPVSGLRAFIASLQAHLLDEE